MQTYEWNQTLKKCNGMHQSNWYFVGFFSLKFARFFNLKNKYLKVLHFIWTTYIPSGETWTIIHLNWCSFFFVLTFCRFGAVLLYIMWVCFTDENVDNSFRMRKRILFVFISKGLCNLYFLWRFEYMFCKLYLEVILNLLF